MALMGSALHYFRIHVILTNPRISGYLSYLPVLDPSFVVIAAAYASQMTVQASFYLHDQYSAAGIM